MDTELEQIKKDIAELRAIVDRIESGIDFLENKINKFERGTSALITALEAVEDYEE